MPLNLDEEYKLYTSNAEREKYDNQATLYSIILSLEYLERAYVRDSITQAQYVALRNSSNCPTSHVFMAGPSGSSGIDAYMRSRRKWTAP